jgi:ribosomal protein RSM22 (predicted rRNA methylase)
MQLPDLLQQSIESKIENISLKALSDASSKLTDRYRTGSKKESYVEQENDRLAYILSRMPATFAVICRVFKELKQRMPEVSFSQFLDLGSGPGTGLWAARESFDSLNEYSAWEYDKGFIDLAKELIEREPSLHPVKWHQKNLESDRDFPPSDLVLISYAIGEIQQKYWEDLFRSLWNSVQKCLVIIEPGTPVGYCRIMEIRKILLSLGAHLVSPCPHEEGCPLTGQDWCHFFARVERSALHRKIKNASMNFEDEKYSYLIFSKVKNFESFPSRIIRHPKINKGFVEVTLCADSKNIINEKITRKDKEKFKLIKKLDWGDII